MPTLDSQILSVFLTRLRESERADSSLVQALSETLTGGKLPKADDLVKLYAISSKGSNT